jgi:hypothetical protein
MQYFDTLPKILQYDNVGTGRVFTNLLARASIIPELLKNPALYYSYDIQEGDTPEIIAHKYYGDSYRYWMVLLANEILDPQWGWPMSNTVFNDYLISKYGSSSTAQNTVHHYEKTLTQFDSGTNTTTTNTVEIDLNTYNTTFATKKSYTLSTGDVTVTVSKSAISYYDYEFKLNESKRNIQILNSNYVNQLETELKNLMSV